MIYADYNATTPLDRRVLDVMLPYMTDVYYNAASTHGAGMQAHQAVIKARVDIAGQIGARMNDIVFTSGATEAINLAVLGCARHAAAEPGRRQIVTCVTEHAAVLDACRHLEERGFPVTWVGVDEHGVIDLDALRAAVTDETLLVSVMAVNNETGVLQPIADIAAIAHERGALFMTDATQAYGKIPLDVKAIGIDMMTFSAHKIYGPKGVGALYIRRGACGLEPMQFGGGQEGGLRSGTLNVPGIVGLAEAGRVALASHDDDQRRVGALRDRFEGRMIAEVGAVVNGGGAPRLYTTSNLLFDGIDLDMLLMHCPDVAVSRGSACSSAKPRPSHVLRAMGRTDAQAASSLRFSFGRFTTEAEVDGVGDAVIAAHEKARAGVV